MIGTVTLQRETIEQLEVTIVTDEDVSADTVQFALPTSTERPSTWKSGAWHESKTGVAVTPTIGASGADLPADSGRYRLYVKISDNPETPVLLCGGVVIT